MNYIELINNFWSISEGEDMSPHDQSTYFAILKYCNSLSWLNPFVCHWEILIQYSKTSKNSFYKSCEALDKIGLIKWEKGQRNSTKKPKIFVLDFKNKEGTNREQRRNNEGTTEEHGGNLYKLVNKETIKLINNNATLVNSELKGWIENHNPIDKEKRDKQFLEFWDLYGKKKDREKCKTKFKNLKDSDIELIFERLPAYTNSTPDLTYRKNPLTWLNGKCWNDEDYKGNNGGSKKITLGRIPL
jgi:NACalpha-BTF3-like transcription factor